MVESKYHSYSQIALGVVFVVWGAMSAIWSEIPGSSFLAVAGFFIIYSGVKHYYRYSYLTNLVANVLAANPRTTIRKIAQEAKIKEKTVYKILNYLRAEGRLKSTFDPATGDLIVYEIDGFRPFDNFSQYPPNAPMPTTPQYQNNTNAYQNVSSQRPPETTYPICPYCGTIVPPDSKFCPNCGASLG